MKKQIILSRILIELNLLNLLIKLSSFKFLKNLSKNLVRVEELGILGDSPEELELLTNPEYYRYGIRSLKYLFESEHEITDQTFLNIKEIHPKNVMFYDKNE